jgi:DNA recombination protein RmuC
MTEVGIALVALAAGLGVGVAIAALRRPGGSAADAGRLEARLEVQSAELRRLADAAAARDGGTDQVRAEIASARRALESLQIRDEERRASDGESRDVVRRLATVLAGGAGKGRAGENVLREHLSELPPGMLACDVRIGGKVVEFALVLPDGRRLPIDSKWTGLAELEALEAAGTPVEREACARAVERVVALRAREVAQYLDPAVTAPVAVAAIPDAAYDVLKRAHADAFVRGVVVVPYTTALPIVLFLYALVQRFGDAADVSASLAEVATLLTSMEGVLENKFARAATMLANGSDELRSHVGKARASVARARAAPTSVGDEDVLSIVR